MDSLNFHLKKIQTFDIFWLGYHGKINKGETSDIDIPEKLWGLFGYIINKKAAKHLLEIFPITLQIDTEMPKAFDKLKVYALKNNYKLIFSPLSQDSPIFGSDIQFSREPFNNTDCYFENSTLLIYIIAIILFTMYIIHIL
jgi:GR25 family glycosyltransferase involved in LPS biosynthesis